MLGNLERQEKQQVKSAHTRSPEKKGEPAGAGSEINFPPQAPKSACGRAGGRLSPAMGLGRARRAGWHEAAAAPPATRSRAKRGPVCLEMTNTITAGGSSPKLFSARTAVCPSKHPSHPQTSGHCPNSPAVLPTALQLLPAAPSLLQQLGLAGALSGIVLLTVTPWLQLGPRPPWPKISALP